VRLPALVRDVWIDYTALSFAAPEKVRFRYKLEGQNPDWKEAVNDRQVQYSNLKPRHYRFRVIACNNSGVWNETGDTLDFSVDPAYYQTAWFQAACVAAFLGALLALHWYRLHQIAREFNARLDGRVEERLRVARDLHDTLLQSFQGLLLQFQAARNLLSRRPADAGQVLDTALDDAARAITEARDSIQGMRLSTVIANELAKSVELLSKELVEQQRAANEDTTAYSVAVEGAPQELHPILWDEVYRITGEALRNAFRHARARRIEVEIRYDARKLRVRVRDDGTGIDARVLQEGRQGHYGIPGMRERAKAIGGQLEIWSEQGAGTEVELTIPASVAYASHTGQRFRLFKSQAGTDS
jgi:signal transduction histidine kinase